MLRPTPGDPRGVEQHHWNTGAEENQQLNPGGPSHLTTARNDFNVKRKYIDVVKMLSGNVILSMKRTECSVKSAFFMF